MDDFLKALIALGPGGIVAGLMFYLWREERSERREMTTKLMVLQGQAIDAENEMTMAVTALAAKLEEWSRRNEPRRTAPAG